MDHEIMGLEARQYKLLEFLKHLQPDSASRLLSNNQRSDSSLQNGQENPSENLTCPTINLPDSTESFISEAKESTPQSSKGKYVKESLTLDPTDKFDRVIIEMVEMNRKKR